MRRLPRHAPDPGPQARVQGFRLGRHQPAVPVAENHTAIPIGSHQESFRTGYGRHSRFPRERERDPDGCGAKTVFPSELFQAVPFRTGYNQWRGNQTIGERGWAVPPNPALEGARALRPFYPDSLHRAGNRYNGDCLVGRRQTFVALTYPSFWDQQFVFDVLISCG